MKNKNWALVPNIFDNKKTVLSFCDAKGYNWYVGRLNGAAIANLFGVNTDEEAYQKIVDVLNREMPRGRVRKHRRAK